MTDFTKIFRRTSYDTISPSRPENDQSGRTVLVSGSSDGIGFNIARAFAEANAKQVILVGRNAEKLEKATQAFEEHKPGCDVWWATCDVSDCHQIGALWQNLHNDKIFVDVLVLCASAMGEAKGIKEVISFFNFNISSNLHMIDHFHNQHPHHGKRQKVLVNVSSAAMHCYNYGNAAYAGSKAGLADYLCPYSYSFYSLESLMGHHVCGVSSG